MMGDFRRTALLLGLRKLFDSRSRFSVYELDALLALANISITKEEHQPFTVLSGVEYSEMSLEFKRELFSLTIEIFRRVPDLQFDESEIFPPQPVPISFRQRVAGLLREAK